MRKSALSRLSSTGEGPVVRGSKASGRNCKASVFGGQRVNHRNQNTEGLGCQVQNLCSVSGALES